MTTRLMRADMRLNPKPVCVNPKLKSPHQLMQDIAKTLLSIPTRFDMRFPYPQETSRAIEMRSCVNKMDVIYPTAKHWKRYITSLDCVSIDPYATKYGTCRRPHGMVDLHALSAISAYFSTIDKRDLKHFHVEQAYRVALQAITGHIERRAEGVMGNASYLAQYLVPAGFMALEIDKSKAETIFEAVMQSGSRMAAFAMYAGTIILWLNFKPCTLPLRVLRQAKQQKTDVAKARMSYKGGISARKVFLRIAWEAFKTKRTYGLTNFQYAVTDHYEYIKGKQAESERWTDKAHNEFAEIGALCGTKGLLGAMRFYTANYFGIKEGYVRGAWVAHVVLLAGLFRTSSANLQEALMASFAIRDEVCDNWHVDYVKQSEWKKQVKRWHNAWRMEKAMAEKDKQAINALDEIEIEGKSMAWMGVKGNKNYKRIMEDNIARSPLNAERIYRYAFVLNAFKDKDAGKWIDRFNKIASKRQEDFT